MSLISDKTNNMIYVTSDDSEQPGQPPRLIRVFAVHMKEPGTNSHPLNAKTILRLYWVDKCIQAGLSVRMVHMPIKLLIYVCLINVL